MGRRHRLCHPFRGAAHYRSGRRNGGPEALTLTWLEPNATCLPRQDQWHLNGIDYEANRQLPLCRRNHPGHLYRVRIGASVVAAGTPSRSPRGEPLYGPDGLKVLSPTSLVTAEGSGLSRSSHSIRHDGTCAHSKHRVRRPRTFAIWGAMPGWSRTRVPFWNPNGTNGPTATKPFRLIETRLMP